MEVDEYPRTRRRPTRWISFIKWKKEFSTRSITSSGSFRLLLLFFLFPFVFLDQFFNFPGDFSYLENPELEFRLKNLVVFLMFPFFVPFNESFSHLINSPTFLEGISYTFTNLPFSQIFSFEATSFQEIESGW